ncbi:MAG: membrane integrity-associated transporter subunit PqiC [Sphingomonadaceae bacterium]|nr:membrane integrity-associated transporter subunit PqiC [Sphingomonadaceae bacterium]
MKPFFALAAAVALLSGCLSLSPAPPPSLMTLTAEQRVAPGAARSAGPGDAITIVEPELDPALQTQRLPVTTSDTAISYLKDALWVETPDVLFQTLLSEVVEARTGRVVLNPAQFSADPGTRVTGQLHRLELDARTREGVIVYDAQISTSAGVRTRRFEARVVAAAEDPQSVAAALNRAANQIAVELSDWVVGG